MSRFLHDKTGPVYVDLDGSLVATDCLVESLVQLLRRRPGDGLRVLPRLLGDRAALKAWVAARAQPDPSRLPYRPEVLAWIRAAREQGRPVVLATASHESVARAVAAHLGLFDDVLASDDVTNRKGDLKREAIEKHAGSRPFDYLGNDRADLPVWRAAGRALVAAPSAATRAAAAAVGDVEVVVERGSALRALWRAARPYQWSKNALVAVPLVLAHRPEADLAAKVGLVFACFCAISSSTYLWNDVLDVEADRAHPRKRQRPFASGALSIPLGLGVAGVGVALGLGTAALLLPGAATLALATYLGLTLAYSLDLKERLFVDVLVLAGLYTVRVLAGGFAAGVPVSPWLLAFSLFFFLSLAFVKRYAELLGARDRRVDSLARRSYRVEDLGLVETMGVASGYLSVLVLGLYVSNDDVTRLYPRPELLWLVSPLMLYWITRMWFLARRRELDEDPVLFAVRDPASYVVGVAVGAIGLLAALGGP